MAGRILSPGMMSRPLIRQFAFCLAALAACGALLVAESVSAQGAGKAAATVTTPTSPASSTATGAPIQSTPPPTTSHGTHVVTVTFDYDFRQTPACTPRITSHCVMQFIAYDISASAKNPTMLFPIPLPPSP